MLLTKADRRSIKDAFSSGRLLVKSPGWRGAVEWKPVTRVRKTATTKNIVRVGGSNGRELRVTEDHTLFGWDNANQCLIGVKAGNLLVVDELVSDGGLVDVRPLIEGAIEPVVYDLTVQDNARFYANGFAISNCPDRNYSMRPPESGPKIRNYTERFGFVWESPQLLVALKIAVGAINLFPPRTNFRLADFVDGGPAGDWQFLLLYKAAAHACRMVQANWIVDEVDYSLGSLSLNLEKSSKYDQLAGVFEQQFETSLEGAKRTLKYTKGLQNSRFVSGVSGLFSFGPSTNRVGLINYPSLLRGGP